MYGGGAPFLTALFVPHLPSQLNSAPITTKQALNRVSHPLFVIPLGTTNTPARASVRYCDLAKMDSNHKAFEQSFKDPKLFPYRLSNGMMIDTPKDIVTWLSDRHTPASQSLQEIYDELNFLDVSQQSLGGVADRPAGFIEDGLFERPETLGLSEDKFRSLFDARRNALLDTATKLSQDRARCPSLIDFPTEILDLVLGTSIPALSLRGMTGETDSVGKTILLSRAAKSGKSLGTSAWSVVGCTIWQPRSCFLCWPSCRTRSGRNVWKRWLRANTWHLRSVEYKYH